MALASSRTNRRRRHTEMAEGMIGPANCRGDLNENGHGQVTAADRGLQIDASGACP